MGEIYTIILAAGASSRFGSAKALAAWDGGTLLSHAIATAKVVGPQVLVVTGAHHDALLPHLTVPYVFNAKWENGMGSSVACGIKALPETADMALVLPVDQPLVTAAHMNALAETVRQTGKAVFTQQGAIMGPPAALPRRLFAAAANLTGEAGLKHMLGKDDWTTIESTDALCDIDTPADLARVSSRP